MTNLQQELTKASRFAIDFQRDIAKSLSTDSLLSGLTRNQRSSVTQIMTSLRTQFKRGFEDIQNDFTAGWIKPEEAMKRVRNLTREMVSETRKAFRGLGDALIINPAEAKRLLDIMNQIGNAAAKTVNAMGGLSQAVASSMSKVQSAFDKEESRLLNLRARGRISAVDYERAGKEAAATFNAAWAREIDRLKKKFQIPDDVMRTLVGQFKPAGFGTGGSQTFGEELLQNTKRQIEGLRNTMRTTIARARLDLAENLIKPHEFEQKVQEAMQRFERGVLTGRARMTKANQLTPEIEQTLAAALSTVPKSVRAAQPLVSQSARTLVKSFSEEYDRAMGQLKLDRAFGRISENEFTARGQAAARAFDKGLTEGLTNLRQAGGGIIPPSDEAFILRRMKDVGGKAGKAFASKFAEDVKVLADAMASAGQALTTRLTLPLGGAGVAALKMAADFESAENRLVLGFGPATEDMRKRLATMREDFPATATEMQNFAVRVAEVFVPLGGATKEIDKLTGKIKDVPKGLDDGLRVVSDMSEEIIRLTKNLVILNPGVNADRAFNAIINATVGRTTELKKLGVVINQEIINETAYRENIARTGAVLSASQNAQAAYIAIMERSALISSAVARAQDTFNLTWEFTKKRITEAGVAIGTIYLPAATAALKQVNLMLKAFAQLDPEVLKSVVRFASLALVIGPLMLVLGKLIGIVVSLAAAWRALRLAMVFGSGVGVLASLARLAGPIGILTSVVLGLAAAFIGYRKASEDATEANEKFSQSLLTMSQAQLVEAQTSLLLEASRLNAQKESITASMQSRAIAEARRKTEASGGTAVYRPNPVFSPAEQRQVDDINAKLATSRNRLDEIGRAMQANAKATAENAKFMEEYRKEFENFQNLARRQTERERLRQEREEWLRFKKDVQTSIDTLRTSMKLGLDITQPLEVVREKLREVQDRLSKAEIGSKLHNDLKQLENDLNLVIAAAAKFDITGLREAIATQISSSSDLVSRAKDKSFNERMALSGELTENANELAALEERVNVILTNRLGTDRQRLQLQRDLLKLQKEQRETAELRTSQMDTMFPGFEQRIDEIGAKLREAQLSLNIGASLPPEEREKFEREVKSTIAQLQRSLSGELGRVLLGDVFKSLDPTTKGQIIEAIGEIFKRNAISAEDFNTKIERADRIIGRLAIGMRGLREIISTVFGQAAEDAERIAGAAFGILEGIQQIRAASKANANRIAQDPFAGKGLNLEELGAMVSGITSVVGAGFAIFNSLSNAIMGDQSNREEVMNIQRANNERLAELNLTMKGFIGSIRDQLKVQDTLNLPLIQQIIASTKTPLFSGATLNARDFDRYLRAAGSSLAELQEIAKQNGITLLDGKGRVVASALDALGQSITAMIEINTKWQNGMNGTIASFDDLRQSVDLFNDVFNVEDSPQRAIDQALSEIATLSPKLFDTFFKGIDPTDAVAMENALQQMTRAFLENAEGFGLLMGGLLDKTQLVQIIQLMAGAFDKLRETTDDLTESMLNVPTWFRREQTRFESVTPRISDVPASALVDTSGGAGAVVSNSFTVNGGFTVNMAQGTNESPEEFADRMVAQARRRAFHETGSSALPGDN